MAQIRERNAAYASLPSLSKILLGSSGGNNYTAHSAELYGIVEVELRCEDFPGGTLPPNAPAAATSESAALSPKHMETVLLPVMCSTEHEADLVSLPPTAIRMPALLLPAASVAVTTAAMTATDIRVLI